MIVLVTRGENRAYRIEVPNSGEHSLLREWLLGKDVNKISLEQHITERTVRQFVERALDLMMDLRWLQVEILNMYGSGTCAMQIADHFEIADRFVELVRSEGVV